MMYSQASFREWRDSRFNPARFTSFVFYYYRRAWEHHPGRMLAKVRRQLGIFYSFHCPAFRAAESFEVANFYNEGLTALSYPGYQREVAGWPPLREYRDATRRLVDSQTYFPEPALMIDANIVASVAALPLMGLFLAGLSAVGLARVRFLKAPWMAGLLAPGWILLLFYGFIFGNCLTISVIHSLDVHRYSTNLLVFCAPALVGTVAWLAEFFLALSLHRTRNALESLPAR